MLLLAAVTAFAFLGSRALISTSEGRYAACAQEMLARGDLIHPTLNGLPHWTKPPVTYWAIAAGLRLVGHNEWGVRLFNAWAFVITAGLVSLLGRRLAGERVGYVAGLIYATAPAPSIAAWIMTTDTLLTLWMTLAVFCWVAASQASRTGSASGWLAGFGAALGLGFLTKGPPVLLALFACAAWPVRPLRRALAGLLPALLAFAVTGLSWYLRVCREDPALLHYFLGEELVNRLTAGAAGVEIKIHNDEWYKGFYIYLPLLAFGLGLWAAPALAAAWKLRARLAPAARRVPAARLLLVWVLGPLIVLLLSSSKLLLYVLPLFAPLAIGAAALLDRAARDTRVHRWALAGALLVLTARGVVSALPLDHDMRRLYRACRAQAPDSEIALFNEQRLYGLQFYLRGRLTRVCEQPLPPWADATLDDWLAGVRRSGRSAALLVLSEETPSCVARAIERQAMTAEVTRFAADHDKTNLLFLLRPGP